jgi:hypothetical protein
LLVARRRKGLFVVMLRESIKIVNQGIRRIDIDYLSASIFHTSVKG